MKRAIARRRERGLPAHDDAIEPYRENPGRERSRSVAELDYLLHEALEATFPASDPFSISTIAIDQPRLANASITNHPKRAKT